MSKTEFEVFCYGSKAVPHERVLAYSLPIEVSAEGKGFRPPWGGKEVDFFRGTAEDVDHAFGRLGQTEIPCPRQDCKVNVRADDKDLKGVIGKVGAADMTEMTLTGLGEATKLQKMRRHAKN